MKVITKRCNKQKKKQKLKKNIYAIFFGSQAKHDE